MVLEGIAAIETLKASLDYQQVRARLIAQNVANADTPGIKAKDLRPFAETFTKTLAQAAELSQNHAAHHAASPRAEGDAKLDRNHEGWERAPDGNSVVLEQEMIKANETRAAYEMASLVLAKHVSMTRSAFGGQG